MQQDKIQNIIKYLSSPALLHYTLPVVMFYVVAGTIAQKYIGLYEATHIFFSAAIIWAGPVPLPGLPIFISIMVINLLFKLAFKSPWRASNAGIIIVHIGVLLLMAGGLLTAMFSQEGYIDLAKGERKAEISDYHIRDMVILNDEKGILYSFDHQSIAKGDIIAIPDSPIKLHIIENCRNCEITRRTDATDEYFGMAQHMVLSPAPLRQNDEENLTGIVFSVSGSENDGIYLAIENVPRHPEIMANGQTYRIAIRKRRTALPFQIELLEFSRDMHPGTAMAQSYQSRVRIHDDGAQWEALISMNEPLRYKGYTFFQSSFIETDNGDVSVLTSVWNIGRSFPYISGITVCIGMILHIFIRRRRPSAKTEPRNNAESTGAADA